MSTALLPQVSTEETGLKRSPTMERTPGGPNDRRVIRRRGSPAQGQALEVLGHAIEYLVDSRLFSSNRREAEDDREAAQILMVLSRAVFEECPEVISVRRQLKRMGWKMVRRVTGYDRRRG